VAKKVENVLPAPALIGHNGGLLNLVQQWDTRAGGIRKYSATDQMIQMVELSGIGSRPKRWKGTTFDMLSRWVTSTQPARIALFMD